MKNDIFTNKVFVILLLVLAFAVGQNAWAEEFKGSGTEKAPYIIATKADWDLLASKSAENSFSDKYFRLDADIDGVTTMVGDNKDFPFSGKIDGNGHTVTLDLSRTENTPDDYSSANEHLQGLALVHYAGDGLEISNLTVDGTIKTNCKFTAGFISYILAGEADARKIIKITNSRSNVSIISNVEGDATSGGFVGLSKNYVDMTFENCVFDGSFNAPKAKQFSGFVGYQQANVKTVIERSLFAPQSVDIAADDGNHRTFCRYANPSSNGKFELIDSYYTTAIGTSQGTPLYKLTLGEGLKAIRADADTIGNGAAVFYGTDGNNGISIGGEEYYKSGATVHLGCSQGLKISSVIYTPQGGSAGVAIIDADGTASFAMPESNTNVMALYGSVAYIDENGDEQTVSDYTLLTSNMSLSDFVNGSWFVVASKLSLEIPTAFSGDAHLILADGAEMTLKKNSGNLLVDNANLSIYGQDAGTGKLTIEVSANETNVGGSVAINGGVVEVSCKNDDGVCSGIAGNVTLNWTRNTNRVKADTYGNSNVTVAEGKFFVDDENKAYSGKLSEEQIAFIAGKVLKPTIPVKYIDADGSEQTLYDYTVLTGCLNTLEEPKKCEETKLASGQWYVVDGIVRYEGELSSAGSIHLVLKDGAKLTVDDDVYVSGEDGLTAEINIYGQSGGMGELIAKSLADYSGNIIFNGGKATINEGIKVAGKYTMNGGEVTANCATERQTGMLLGFGIVGLFVTINDGILNSTSCISDETNRLMAIYGEAAVEINGGTINLAASYSGIMGISVSINGGNVSIKKATNGVLGKNVSFTGGNIDMDGNVTTRTNTGSFDDDDDDAIVLDWTNSTDSFKASGFVGPVVIAKGKYFTDGEGYVYSGEIAYSEENGTVLDGKTLKPFVSFVTFDAQNGSDPSTVAASYANGGWFVTAPAAPIRDGFTFLGWFTSKDGDTEFDFNEAVVENTIVYAKWKENAPVEYIDENGKPQILEPGDYTVLTEKTIVGSLGDGWYVVQGKVKYASQVEFSGDAHLILADDATLEIETWNDYGIYASNNLTIYRQSGQRGTLKAATSGMYGIYSNGNITIIGGTVTATGEHDGIYGYEGVSISGGKVTATGTGLQGSGIFSIGGDITISGGTVEATGGYDGIYASNKITLSWTNSIDRIKASSYFSGDGSVEIAEGKYFKDEDGKVYSGTLSSTQLDIIKDKTLKPCYAVTLDRQDGSEPVVVAANFDENGVAHVAKPENPTRDGFKFLGWFTTADGNIEFDFTAAVTSNTTAYAKWGVPYIDENGKEQVATEYTVLTGKTYVSSLPGGWYVVEGEVKYTSTVSFSGEAHLILADGATMVIETNSSGIYASNNLTIYGQSEQSGNLKATATGSCGINGWGDITISGGTVEATGEYFGISGSGDITISGGTVEATGEYFGINGSGDITISGGTVEATGGYDGIFADNNITLSWTNITDFIKASSYYSKNGVSIAEGKSFKDEDGNVYRGTLTAGQLAYLKGQKIEPFEGVSVSFVDNFSGASEVISEIAVDGKGHVSAPSKHPFHSGYAFVGWFTAPEGGSEFDFTKAVTENTAAYAKWKENNTPVEYIDENGKTKNTKNYILLTNDINVGNLPEGWFVVEGEVNYTSQVMFSGDAHLILADGAKLEIESETYGINAEKSLTIYGQSEQSGNLKVTATGSCGISGWGDITISGGTVTATGSCGISGSGDITISGGTVEATGEYYGIYTRNKITLSWTNSTDRIKASSYNGSVEIAEGKYFKDEDGKVYSGTLSAQAIAGKTLVPSSFEGKFLSDVNIAVADIPVQNYNDGKPVCPKSVIVTDGKDTLKAGTDYTVTCFNNTTVSSATLDEAAIAQITGKGNYAGAIQKRFFIWNNIHDYAAVQVYKDKKGGSHAEINGEYEGTDAVNITEDIENVAVTFNRVFTPNSGFATIMFPFDINAKKLTGVKSIIEFAGVFDNNGKNAVGMTYVWCNATLGEQELEKGHPDCNKYSGELKAYTPYMIEMESATLGINGGVKLVKWNEYDEDNKRVGDAPEGNWVFRGTLQKKEWSKEDDAIKNGQIWAFAGSERNGASIGTFVQFGGNNWVNPFRAYLVDCTKYPDPDASESKDNQPKPSLVSRYRFADALAPTNSAENSLSAKTPAAVAASETASIEGMDIVIVYGDKDSVGEHTTVIGRMNPATGEIRMLPRTKQTYDLKGRRVGNGKKAKGAYYRK